MLTRGLLRKPKKTFWQKCADKAMAFSSMFRVTPSGETVEQWWCKEHTVYDGCVTQCGCKGTCAIHSDAAVAAAFKPLPGLPVLNAHIRPSDGSEFRTVTSERDHSWAAPILPKVSEGLILKDIKGTPIYKCPCDCHTRLAGHNDNCASWCCRKLRETAQRDGSIDMDEPCWCLCHDLGEVECKGQITCCAAYCRNTETDEHPIFLMDDSVWPWNASLRTRNWNKDSAMSDVIHLHMTVEGKPEAVDLFHVILATVDPDYPRKPMAKPTDTIPICSGCNGIIWKDMFLKPEELIKAAKDASEGAGTPVMVRVHKWWKEKKCRKKFKQSRVLQVPA
jgi:hypothetical protein